MTCRQAALAALAVLALIWPAVGVAACPPPSAELLFHSCWGRARMDVALLPEELPLPPAGGSGRRLIVTGSYTATDTRGEGLPKPVGLFVDGGQVINPNLGRMDGVLVVDPEIGLPSLHHRARVPLGGDVYDLSELVQRRAFLSAAAASGCSVLQSHLLIVDGTVDVAPQENAPLFPRRMLFVDADGFGIFQPSGALTLLDAAERLAKAHAPQMALNLDMGSYDYCRSAVDGLEFGCGVLGSNDTSRLSNLLVLRVQ